METDEGATGRPLAGAAVLVTGAAQGIGRGIAEACAHAGADVAVADRDAEGAGALAAALDAAGTRCVALSADVADAGSVAAMVADAAAALGRLTGLVNNAGVLHNDAVVDLTEETWDRVLNVNLKGPWLCIRAALPHLRAAGGAIVNIASIEALGAAAGHVAYSVSKAGLLNLTRTVAIEHGRDGVRCNAVCPGTIETELTAAHFAGYPDPQATRDEYVARNFAGRLGTPADIAAAVVYLLSPAAGFVNGAVLVVDGGRLAKVP